MVDLLLPGIATTRVATPRLTQSVLHPEGVDPAGAVRPCSSCTAT